MAAILASFNYSGPQPGAVAMGIAAGCAAIFLFALSRSRLAGFFGSGLACGAAAWIVAGTGRGDMTQLFQLMWGTAFGVASAVVGLVDTLAIRCVFRRTAGPPG